MFSLYFEAANFFLIGLPECIILTILTLILLKQNIKNKAMLITLIGFIMALVVLIFRSANLNIGLHTTFAVLTLALLTSHFFKTSKLQSLVASIICMISLFLAEFLIFVFYKYLFVINVNNPVNINYSWVIYNWLHIMLLALLALLIKKSNWYQQSTFFSTQA
ncbi:MAG: hypothetical protein FWC60_11960 [Firmicutes bacterium]|nr:hypothetical protein [Bacillota bacterium]